MIVRVEKHTSQYSIIDNTGPNDPRLGLKARGLLVYLLTKPDNWEVTVQGIISQVPDGRVAVQAALKELEQFGYAVYRSVRGEHGRLLGKQWVIFEHSQLPSVDQSQNTDHRQAGFPIIGKTDYRKNRLSENLQQVSTIYKVNTKAKKGLIQSAPASKKSDSQNPEFPFSPPVPAAPPTLFSDSGWVEKGLEAWRSSLLAEGFSQDVDTDYYYRRCQSWSNKNSRSLKDWIQFAVGIATDDSNQGKLKLKSAQHNDNNTGNSAPHDNPKQSNNQSFDKTRTLSRAARILGRTGS